MKRVNKLNSGRIFRSWGSIFSVGMLLFVMGSLKSQAIDSLILNKPGWVLSGNYSAAALLSNPRSSSNFSYNDSLAGASYNSNFSAEYALDLTPVVSASEGVLEISFNYSYRNTGFDSLLIEFWNADSARYVSLAEIGLSSTTISPQSNYCSGTSSITYKLWLSNFSSNNLSNFKLRIRYNDEGVQAYGFCIKDLRIKSSTCVVAPSVNLLASKAIDADFRLGLSSGSDNFFYKDSIKYELRVDTSSSFSNPRVINSTSYLNNNLNNRFFRLYHADTSSLDKSYKSTSGTGTAATGNNYGWATSSEFQSIDTFLQYFGMSSLDIGKLKNLKDKIEIDFYLRDRRSAYSSRSGHTGYYLLASLNSTNVLDTFSGTPGYNFVVTYNASGDSIKIEDSHSGPNNYGSVYGIVIRSLFAESDLKASGLTQSTKYYYSARLKQCVGTSSGPWSASKTFKTKCGTAPILSYTQDFESVTTVSAFNKIAFVVPKCDEVDTVSGDFRINYGSLTRSRHPTSGSSKYATVGKNSDVLFKTPLIKFQANSTYKFDMKYTSDGLLGFSYTVGVYKYRNRDSILAGKGRVMLIDSVVVGARSLNGPSDVNPYLGVRKYFNFNVSDSGNYYVVLRVKGNANPFYFTFDDINIDLAKSSTCFSPSNIVSTVAYGDSVSISYTSNSRSSTGSAMYQIDIAAPGIEAGLGSLSVVSDTFATLRGLTQLTNYRVYVRAVCGAGDTSDWSLLPATFNSGCPFYKLPYNYGFETSACWSNGANAKYKAFTYQSGQTPSLSTGPYGASQGNKYVFTEASRVATTDTFLIYSPQIKLDTVANKYGVGIQFDYHMFGAGIGNLLLQLERPINSGNYVTLVEFVGQQQSSNSAAWKTAQYILSQDSLVNTLLKFRFLGTGITNSSGDMSVDNFRVKYVVSSCNSTPSGFVTSEITETSAKVKWVEGFRGVSSYKVIYSRDTSIYGIEGTLYTAYDSVTVNGLMQGNLYKVYLTPICGTDTGKIYSYLGEISTLCSSLGVLPYNYGFETNSICWSNDANTKYKAFTQGIGGTPTSSTGPSGASQGSRYIYYEATGVTTTDTFLIYSPKISLDTNTNKNGIDIQFDYHMYGADMGRLLLQLERPINSGNYVTLVEFVGQQQTSSAAAWKTAQYILPQDSLVDTLLKFRFLGTGRTSFEGDMAVDNFRVKYAASSCNSSPSGFVTSKITETSAKVKWVEGFSSNISSYKVIYSRDTSVYGIEGTLYTAYDSLTINGLIPGNLYKVYLTPICGTDTSKIYSYLGEISTLCSSLGVLPYNYGFETNSICWSNDANAKYKAFTQRSGDTPSTGTGPSGASQGSKYVFTEASGVATTDTFLIYSPNIKLDTVANKNGVEIQFDYHMYGSGMGSLLLQLERPINSGKYVTLVKFVGQQQTSSEAAWKTARYILPQDSLVDTLLKFRFLGTGISSFRSDMAVDNFRIKYAASSCNSSPSGFVTSKITETSAKVKWVEGFRGVSSYKVIYSRDTSVYGIEGTLYTAYDSLTINGLMPGNLYKVYLTPICGTDTSKIYSYLGEISTLCSSLGVLPYNYGFETNSICWSNDANAKYKAFTQRSGDTPSTGTGPSGASQGSKYVFTEASGVATTDTFLIYSPNIKLDTVANKNGVEIQFDYHMYGSGMGSLLLQLERPINSGKYVTLVKFVGQQQTSSEAAWKTARYILPQDSLVDTLLKFRFLGTGRTSYFSDMAVDNFSVKYFKCVFSTEIRLSRSDSTLDPSNDKDAFNLYTTNPNSYRHVWSNSMTTDSVFSITSQMIKASGGSIRNEISVEVTDLKGCKARDTTYVYYKDTCTFSTEIRLSRSDSTLDSRDDKDAFNLYTTNPNSYRHVWSNSTISDSVLTITSQMIKAAGANIMNEITVEVTDLNGCKSRDTAYVYYKDKGIVNLGEVLLNLEVYPNPSKGIFSIEMNIEEGIEYVSYKVLDLTGRLVKSYAKEQGGKVIKKEIDISDKSEGVYILMIETERGVIVNRLSLIK